MVDVRAQGFLRHRVHRFGADERFRIVEVSIRRVLRRGRGPGSLSDNPISGYCLLPNHWRKELAARCESNRPFISNLERGVMIPSLTMVLRLAEALECRVYELVRVFDQGRLR